MPSFFVPTPGDLTAQESQPLMAYARGSAREGVEGGGGGGGGGGLSAAGIHLCTLKKPTAFSILSHVAIHLLNRKQKMGKLTFGNICIVIAYHFYG